MTESYKNAGVDIDAGNEFIDNITPIAKSTYRPEVLAGIGGFAAHVSLKLDNMAEPVLVSSTDGVGTKLKLAQRLNKYDTIGIDLVAMCVNDVCCSGARPLFFLDYYAVHRLKVAEGSVIIKGIADGCKIAGCALVGGETAELPGIYQKGDFDMAGFAVGIVDKKKIIDGSSISIGNTIVGITSSGPHSNGYSLIRKICDDSRLDLNLPLEGSGKTLGEMLITPTKIYAQLIMNLIRDFEINGIAHITGGGLVENIPRILPDGCRAKINTASWERPVIFRFLQEKGNISEPEMQRVFNLGIGMVLIVPEEKTVDICERIRSFGGMGLVIGEITRRTKGQPKISMG